MYLSFSTSRFKDQLGFSLRDYEAFRRADAALSELATVSMYGRFTMNVNGSAELVSGEHVSGGYFSMMGVRPALGRFITPEDDQPGSAHVVVLSHGCWTRRFGADSGVIGRELAINGERAIIIGVTAASFNGINPGYAPELRLPISHRPMPSGERGRQLDAHAALIGRLKPGVSLEKAEAYLRTVYAARQREKAEHLSAAAREGFLNNGAYLQVKQVGRGLFGLDNTYGAALLVALAITGVVLLIACVNLAGLLLSQAERRQYEIGVRMAIGASRGRIIRQIPAKVFCFRCSEREQAFCSHIGLRIRRFDGATGGIWSTARLRSDPAEFPHFLVRYGALCADCRSVRPRPGRSDNTQGRCERDETRR